MAEDRGGEERSLEDRIAAARARAGLDRPPARSAGGMSGAWGIGLRVGVELVSALAVGLAIGWALDAWLGTRPWLLLLFVLLGGVAGILNVYRLFSPRRT